jgi:hypothetical protein
LVFYSRSLLALVGFTVLDRVYFLSETACVHSLNVSLLRHVYVVVLDLYGLGGA